MLHVIMTSVLRIGMIHGRSLMPIAMYTGRGWSRQHVERVRDPNVVHNPPAKQHRRRGESLQRERHQGKEGNEITHSMHCDQE
jgi:hypothetical protein